MKALISGAGVAGPTLAYWLAQGGHEVHVVERAPAMRDGGYLVDFWGAGFDVAERMGVAGEIRSLGYRMREARNVDAHGRRFAGLNPQAFLAAADDRYVTIARSDLAAVIGRSVAGAVQFRFADEIVNIADQGPAPVRVGFASGGTGDFDLVVGADGLHSAVRRLVFGPDERYESYLGVAFAAFEIEGYEPRDDLVAVMHAGVGHNVVRVTLRDGATLVLLSWRQPTLPPHEDREAQFDVIRRAFARGEWEIPQLLAAMPSARSFFFDRVSQISMPGWSKGRVVLTGDAAAAPSFLAGQGSALAMVEAYVLAAELRNQTDLAAALAGYENRLTTFIAAKQKAALRLGPVFAPSNRWQLAVRNAGVWLMSMPLVARFGMGTTFHDAIELPAMPT